MELDPDDGLHARFANVQANSEQERAESASELFGIMEKKMETLGPFKGI